MKTFASQGVVSTSSAKVGVLTIDVEDWYHIIDVPSSPPIEKWSTMPSRVETNLLRLLDLLDANNVRATCFFLGWIAERFPGLVRETARRGHEIASHGYNHELAYRMTAGQALEDMTRTRRLLEDICGRQVVGYRASGFSAGPSTPWFFEQLSLAGYSYDSSVFPAGHGHGGDTSAPLGPHRIETRSGIITEFPISVTTFFGHRVCCFGGGYLRFFPYRIIRRQARRILCENRPVVFYVHPREIDPSQPRLPMSLRRRFKSYYNLRSTEAKLRRLVADFSFARMVDLLPRVSMPQETV